MGYSLGKRSLAKLVGVHPALAFAVMEAIKISNVDFGVTDGVRSLQRQRELVKRGRSKTMRSYHLEGLAVDLVPFVDGKYIWSNKKAFVDIETAMMHVMWNHNIEIDRGYTLWGWDMPHWQMTKMRKKYDIRKIKGIK